MLARISTPAIFSLLVYLFISHIAGPVIADCSDGEMTAVFIVSGIYPGTDLQLDLLTVFPVGETTYPTDEQMISSILSIQPGYNYQQTELVGPFYQYFQHPGDFGAVAIVDSRNGAVDFAGTVVWMGEGSVNAPSVSTFDWSFPSVNPASEPQSVEVMDNPYWNESLSTPEEVTDSTLAYLRQTDVLLSFNACGPYSVVSYIYTPAVGATDPLVAQCVVLVSGHCGPPWSGEPVSTESVSWGQVKSLFR